MLMVVTKIACCPLMAFSQLISPQNRSAATISAGTSHLKMGDIPAAGP
jgi:hypothetical protein